MKHPRASKAAAAVLDELFRHAMAAHRRHSKIPKSYRTWRDTGREGYVWVAIAKWHLKKMKERKK